MVNNTTLSSDYHTSSYSTAYITLGGGDVSSRDALVSSSVRAWASRRHAFSVEMTKAMHAPVITRTDAQGGSDPTVGQNIQLRRKIKISLTSSIGVSGKGLLSLSFQAVVNVMEQQQKTLFHLDFVSIYGCLISDCNGLCRYNLVWFQVL